MLVLCASYIQSIHVVKAMGIAIGRCQHEHHLFAAPKHDITKHNILFQEAFARVN